MATTVSSPNEVNRAETTTVRVTQHSHAKLRRLAEELGRPISVVIDEAVERYRRDVFLERANEEYERLRADPQSWSSEIAERRELEGSLKDGLVPEEWSEDDFVPDAEAEPR